VLGEGGFVPARAHHGAHFQLQIYPAGPAAADTLARLGSGAVQTQLRRGPGGAFPTVLWQNTVCISYPSRMAKTRSR
jgi:hypothetical protein